MNVPPQSEALVLDRKGGIKRKLGPGTHFCTPLLENVIIEETIPERYVGEESSEMIDGCNITVFVVWRIADLEVYHAKGREAATPLIRQKIKDAIDRAHASELEQGEIHSFVQSTLRKEAQPLKQIGVRLIRAFPRSGNCTLN